MKDQLLVAFKGKKDNELGLRYIDMEKFWVEGWRIKSMIHTDESRNTTIQFLLEKKQGY